GLALIGLFCLNFSFAQQVETQEDFPYSNRFSLVSGVNQVLLGGANLEANWYTKRMSFDYSHGWNLQFSGAALTEMDQAQGLALRMPWTTGFGVGYRITKFLDVRLEPKLHRYELFYEGQNFSGDPITAYTTATLGIGLYYRYYPFRKRNDWSQGIVIVPNARFWPNIWSSLPDNEYNYTNANTEAPATHAAAQQGLPGTGGFFMNVSIGYTFGGK
ncbi:MAG: hypothetical protein AAFN10_25675, partial [Bacteroidota bacterium]